MEALLVDGVRLEARWWHPGDASADRPPLVLLHEGLGCVATWRDFPAALARAAGRRVLAYSRRGYGRSDRRGRGLPASYHHDEARDVLPRVLDTAGIDRAALVGHSDGATIALLAAGLRPDRVQALVLEAPHVMVEDVALTAIAAMRRRYDTTDLRARLARVHDHVDEAFRGWSDAWLDPAFRAWDIRAALPAVRCPVLVVQGTEDEYGTGAQVEAVAAGVAGPVWPLLLDGCGHSPQRDREPDVLAACIRLLAHPTDAEIGLDPRQRPV